MGEGHDRHLKLKDKIRPVTSLANFQPAPDSPGLVAKIPVLHSGMRESLTGRQIAHRDTLEDNFCCPDIQTTTNPFRR
jgi:hypothetical protein